MKPNFAAIAVTTTIMPPSTTARGTAAITPTATGITATAVAAISPTSAGRLLLLQHLLLLLLLLLLQLQIELRLLI